MRGGTIWYRNSQYGSVKPGLGGCLHRKLDAAAFLSPLPSLYWMPNLTSWLPLMNSLAKCVNTTSACVYFSFRPLNQKIPPRLRAGPGYVASCSHSSVLPVRESMS